MPPRCSIHDKLIEEIDNTTLEIVTALYDHVMIDDRASDSDSNIILSPPSLIPPISLTVLAATPATQVI
jgi:hypothetical protein